MESRTNLIASSPAWGWLLDGYRVSAEGPIQGKAGVGLLEVTECTLYPIAESSTLSSAFTSPGILRPSDTEQIVCITFTYVR
jgi:hypothetical protein